MLHSLYVKQIALIDELNIAFDAGLNVLTGETGAGKSILVDAMNLILGERADRELIRNGCEKAVVEGTLRLPTDAHAAWFEENGVDAEEETTISREISISGKNVCRVNGSMVTLAALKSLMDRIVDLHGQHEHQSLLYPANHIHFLDGFGKDKIAPLQQKIEREYRALKEKQRSLNEIGGDDAQRERTMDLLRFQVQEIEACNVQVGEIESLKSERELLNHAQTIEFALGRSYAALYEGGEEIPSALSMMQSAAHELGQICRFDEKFDTLHQNLQELCYSVEDIAHEVRRAEDGITFDEERQAEIEMRLDALSALRRKYGDAEEDILGFLLDAQQKLEQLEQSETLRVRYAEEIEQHKRKLYEQYEALAKARRSAADKLQKQIARELGDLGMTKARFEIAFAEQPSFEQTTFSANGFDQVEFFFSANVGEPLRPLAKIASGGEISRIMLAFKNVAAETDQISTLIFDEVDTGISGKIALVIAQKMASIARHKQVICVTHLPQIAAAADRNFLIEKATKNGSTQATVQQLEEDGAVAEVARLAGGMESEHAMAYARELLEHAAQMKKTMG